MNLDPGNIFLIAAIVVFIAYFLGKNLFTKKKIRAAIAEGAVVVDVRTPSEYAGGHYEGAINIPVDSISGKLEKIGPKDKPVIVYCASGSRSSAAAGILKAAGYQRVVNAGGIAAIMSI
jgi:phage shock protein E